MLITYLKILRLGGIHKYIWGRLGLSQLTFAENYSTRSFRSIQNAGLVGLGDVGTILPQILGRLE